LFNLPREIVPMRQTDYEAALADFLRNKGVTRCPTACAAPTRGSVAEADRATLRSYQDTREAARLEKLGAFRQVVPAFPAQAVTLTPSHPSSGSDVRTASIITSV
jgi:hypothetical protein